MTTNQTNNTKKTKSKSETVTIRISRETREQLRIISKKNLKNESQIIRQLIENGLDNFPNQPKNISPMKENYLDQRTRTTENNWLGHEKPISKLIFATSLILTIDTGKKTTEIIKLLQHYLNECGILIDKNQNRIKLENYYLEIRRLIVSNLSPSQIALIVIDSFVLSFLSLIFPSPVFMASELSMLMIDSYDMQLPQNSTK